MNGNRMKYASTPTYGMQKRGFLKKPAPARTAPETPDFSQVPQSAGSMPFIPQAPLQQPGVSQASPFFPQFQTQFSQAQQTSQPMQVPFSAPAFYQSGTPFPPQQTMAQPLGNSQPPVQNSGAFAGRSQGFVPPQQSAGQPLMQPASFSQSVPSFAQQPFGASTQQGFSFAPPSFQSAPVQNPPFAQAEAQQPVSPFAVNTPEKKPAKEQPPIDVDKLWAVFLFGFLPLLFLPCLFVTGTLGVLRYVFLGLAVVGLGAMWYRQMFTPTTRMIVSMLYVALCIGVIFMQLQANNDTQRTAAYTPQQPQVVSQQQTPDDAVVAAAAPTEAPTPTPVPTVSGPSEAERRLELFMNLWALNNATEMVQLVQPSWCSAQENPSQSLFYVLANRTPQSFVIEDINGTEQDNSRTITMRATISKNNGKTPSIFRFMVMMVKEGGEWYVNPNSLATNDEVEQVDENVVNNKNAVGDTTPAPRTTVTPAPPASTLLYYNLGGNSYHMDPQCQSVAAENLPFDVSFSYAELKSVKNSLNLTPCLRCDAPTNTLEDVGL